MDIKEIRNAPTSKDCFISKYASFIFYLGVFILPIIFFFIGYILGSIKPL